MLCQFNCVKETAKIVLQVARGVQVTKPSAKGPLSTMLHPSSPSLLSLGHAPLISLSLDHAPLISLSLDHAPLISLSLDHAPFSPLLQSHTLFSQGHLKHYWHRRDVRSPLAPHCPVTTRRWPQRSAVWLSHSRNAGCRIWSPSLQTPAKPANHSWDLATSNDVSMNSSINRSDRPRLRHTMPCDWATILLDDTHRYVNAMYWPPSF